MDVEVDGAQGEPIIGPLPVTLVLLAGGQSRRMGRSKALLPIGGATLIEWQVARLRGGFEEVLIAVDSIDQVPAALGGLTVLDRASGRGPMSGLEAGLAAAGAPLVFGLACDMPRAGPEHAALLERELGNQDAAVPRSARGPEPLCGIYRRERVLPAVRAALDAGELRLAALLERLDVAYVDAGRFGAALENLNSPAAYEAFLGGRRP